MMTDVRVWASQLVEDLSEQEMVDVIANGAEGFIGRRARNLPPGLEADDREALVEEVERACRARVEPRE